jgi:putative hydroxymethylpyrimidine transport system substrate-binding protein
MYNATSHVIKETPMKNLHHRSLSRRTFTGLAASAALSLPPSASLVRAQDATELSLALDWYPNANHAGLFLAQQRGWFADAGLTVDPYTPSDPTTVLQTVGAGRDDFGISYQTDVLLARAQGVPVVSVAALVQHPLVTVMSLTEAGIASPADLTGKTVGYPGIPSQAAFLETMMEGDGASIADVSLVNIGFNLLPALISGQVDAVLGGFWSHETILAEREGLAIDVMRVEKWGVPDYYELVLVCSEQTIVDRPETVSTLLSVLQRGYLEAIANPEEALAALTGAYPELDQEVEREGIALLSTVWLDDPPIFGHQDPARWESFGAWMKSRRLIPEDLDIAFAFETDLLPATLATPVSKR